MLLCSPFVPGYPSLDLVEVASLGSAYPKSTGAGRARFLEGWELTPSTLCGLPVTHMHVGFNKLKGLNENDKNYRF